jgi:hypothetical protein
MQILIMDNTDDFDSSSVVFSTRYPYQKMSLILGLTPVTEICKQNESTDVFSKPVKVECPKCTIDLEFLMFIRQITFNG